jgi:hypothetical protein
MSSRRAVIFLISGLMCLATLILTAYVSFQAARIYSIPYPIRLLDQRRELFTSYAQSILAGDAVKRDDGQGFAVPSELAKTGVNYIRESNGGVIFDFESMPTDPTEQLIFCPSGYHGLPNIQIKGQSNTLRFQVINDHWFYWETDW